MRTGIFTAACVFTIAAASFADDAARLDRYLRDGSIADGIAAFSGSSDNSETFSLALLQTLDGLQKFSAGFSNTGINPDITRSGIPFLRAISPPSSISTDAITPEAAAALFTEFKHALLRANTTLASMDGEDFGVTVNLSRVRLDLDGNGVVATNEFLVNSLRRPFGFSPPSPGEQDLVIRFDSADAAWLKGYTHFLSGVLSVITAYDWMPVWNQCAHVVFRNPLPRPPIAQASRPLATGTDLTSALDMIAAIHEMRLEPLRKDALETARNEFLSMVACSRLCWQRVLAESDNANEWLPSPTQTGPAGAKVTAEQIEGWHRVLDELELVLKGERLMPHWRLKPGTGISIARMAENRRFWVCEGISY